MSNSSPDQSELFEHAAGLLNKFKYEYRLRHGVEPTINVIRDKYNMRDLVAELGFERVRRLIDFYFRTGGDHSIKRFFYQYDELLRMQRLQARDAMRRKRLLSGGQ